MGTLHELEESIVTEARIAAARTERELQEELERIRIETERAVAERRDALMLEARKRHDAALARMRVQQQLASSQEALAAKNEELEAVFADASSRLAGLRGGARTRLLDALWKRAQSRVDAQRVMVAKKDLAYFSRKRVKATVIDGIGGFIAVGRGGEVSVDHRFETLLQEVRERRLAEIAGTLFADTSRRAVDASTRERRPRRRGAR